MCVNLKILTYFAILNGVLIETNSLILKMKSQVIILYK